MNKVSNNCKSLEKRLKEAGKIKKYNKQEGMYRTEKLKQHSYEHQYV